MYLLYINIFAKLLYGVFFWCLSEEEEYINSYYYTRISMYLRIRQHSRVDCDCLLKSPQKKPEHTVKLRTRIIQIIKHNTAVR